MTVATAAESKKANAAFFSNSRSSAIADNADAIQNIVQVMTVRVESSAADQDLTIPHYVGFCAPLYADYPNAPIGAEYLEITVDSTTTPTAYRARKWIYTFGGWERLLSAGMSTSGVAGAYNSYAGTSVKVIEARAIFPTTSCDNYLGYFRTQATGTTQNVASVRGYAQSLGNNSNVTGGDFTGELGVANHSNGSIVAVTGQASIASGLTVTAGALFSLRLTANLASAATGLQHGGAAFIALTDQHATNKVKYLIDANSDASSPIDTGTGTSHLECYESDGMTFTCKGGYRIYTLGGGELYIPFGTLAS